MHCCTSIRFTARIFNYKSGNRHPKNMTGEKFYTKKIFQIFCDFSHKKKGKSIHIFLEPPCRFYSTPTPLFVLPNGLGIHSHFVSVCSINLRRCDRTTSERASELAGGFDDITWKNGRVQQNKRQSPYKLFT